MDYIPERPKASEILEYARDKGVGVEYSSNALRRNWCEDSVMQLDGALHGINNRLVRLEERVEDNAKQKKDALNDGFWLGVLFGLFIGKGPVVD